MKYFCCCFAKKQSEGKKACKMPTKEKCKEDQNQRDKGYHWGSFGGKVSEKAPTEKSKHCEIGKEENGKKSNTFDWGFCKKDEKTPTKSPGGKMPDWSGFGQKFNEKVYTCCCDNFVLFCPFSN